MKKLITELLLRDIEKLISEQLKKISKKVYKFRKKKKSDCQRKIFD